MIIHISVQVLKNLYPTFYCKCESRIYTNEELKWDAPKERLLIRWWYLT